MISMRKFLLVVNPVAGNRDKFNTVQQVRAFAKLKQVTLIDFQTSGSGDDDALVCCYKMHMPERILVVGGDGTIHLVVQSLYFFKPFLAIIPQGSANGLAVDCDIPENLNAALEVAFSNIFMEVDLLKINQYICIHLSDIGRNAALIKNYQKSVIRGKIGYFLQAITTWVNDIVPFKVAITTATQHFEYKAEMVVIANSKKYGTGVTINPLGVIDDGKFEIVVLKDLDLVILGKILTGNFPVDADAVFITSTQKATITSSRMVYFQIDGEYLGKVNRLQIEVLPKYIKLAVPNS